MTCGKGTVKNRCLQAGCECASLGHTVAFSFLILGPLEVQEDGTTLRLGSGRQRGLLALLLVHANELVSAERLIDELWSGRPPPTAQKALQGYVSQLRRALTADTILTRGSGYVLVATQTDAKEFERLTRLASEQDADEAILTLERALALWRGRAFEEFEYEEWAQLEIARLEGLRLAATEQRIEAEMELGHHAALVPELEKRVAQHPLREQLRGLLMVALYRSGRHADALEVYRRGRQVLHDELGLEPSPFLAELERHILSHDATLEAPARGSLPSGTVTESTKEPPKPRRRRLLAVVAVSLAVIVATAIALAVGGGATQKMLPNSLVRIDPKTLKATQVAQVGDAPDLVISSGGYLWVTNNILRDSAASGIVNAGDRTLTRVDPSTGDTVVVGGGLAPCGLTADPSGDVWVVNCYPPKTSPGDNVQRIDAKTLKFEATWSVPGGPGFYRGRAYGGGSLWVSGGGDQNRDMLTQVDPQTGAQQTIRLGRYTGGLAWSEGYGDLWITNFDRGSLMRLHPATGAPKTFDGVAINPVSPVVDGNVVWVGDWSKPQVVRVPAVGPVRPHSISLPVHTTKCPTISCVWTVAAGAGAIWATTPEDHALWRINPKTYAVKRISLPYPPTGVTADANDVWVTVRGSS